MFILKTKNSKNTLLLVGRILIVKGVVNVVKKIRIRKYRKLKDITFNFENDINIISGTNGTCKTSVLYLVSNSYQSVISSNKSTEIKKCLKVIKSINNSFNPKVESLTRGDKILNDPAPGVSGELLEVSYHNSSNLLFRKHNSTTQGRYAIKPNYRRGRGEKLPEKPIIYLGLSRLVSFGEFEIDESVKNIKGNLPAEYRTEIADLYAQFTGIVLEDISYNKMGNLKTRGDFKSDIEGVDSNTISAGEDNLYIIITALVSLKYYYKVSEQNTEEISSILAIDEVDATLHPSYQIKLFNLIKEYGQLYKIQFFATTHGMNLIEYALEQDANVFYLVDQKDYVDIVTKEDDLDIFSIKMLLEAKTSTQVMKTSKIPIFLEDDEARLFLKRIFDYFIEKYDPEFRNVSNYFHFVDCKIGSENLKSMFQDKILINDLIKAVCILDGDAQSNMNNNIITLPGNKNPEQLLLDYLGTVYSSSLSKYKVFWNPQNSLTRKHGYQKSVVKEQILDEYDSVKNELKSAKDAGESTKGILRDKMKKLFNNHEIFFNELIIFWLDDDQNKSELEKFRSSLYSVFKKTALAHNIDKKSWNNTKIN